MKITILVFLGLMGLLGFLTSAVYDLYQINKYKSQILDLRTSSLEIEKATMKLNCKALVLKLATIEKNMNPDFKECE